MTNIKQEITKINDNEYIGCVLYNPTKNIIKSFLKYKIGVCIKPKVEVSVSRSSTKPSMS
jgi:hypothetical protein